MDGDNIADEDGNESEGERSQKLLIAKTAALLILWLIVGATLLVVLWLLAVIAISLISSL